MATPFKVVGTPELTQVPSIHFALHFNRMPDFFTLDANQRQADSFQIFVALNPATPNPANPQSVDVLIRGDEIHLAKSIRIRDARPATADPSAGGWGALRGTVLYQLQAEGDGTAWLSFDVTYSLLGIAGQFAYALETYNYGAQVDHVGGVAP